MMWPLDLRTSLWRLAGLAFERSMADLLCHRTPLLLYGSMALLSYIIMKLCTILFLLCLVWCPCMAINGSIQYNGGFLPDIILVTQCYYHRGTRLNA